jgi:hypothetical protein
VLESLHNTKSGRCWMMGVGPSLLLQTQYMDALADEDTFTCNRMPLWTDLPFVPTYYGVTEPANAENLDYYDNMTKEFWPCPDPLRFVVHPTEVKRHGWIWVPKEFEGGPLAMASHGIRGMGDTLGRLKTGRHSPLTLSQIAIWMGYREIIFIGIDFSPKGYVFDLEANPGQTVTHRAIYGAQRSHVRAYSDFTANGGVMWDCTPDGAMNDVGCGKVRGARPQGGKAMPYKSIEELLT